MIALIEEGHLRPTAAAIADRAEVSVRSVFQHFNDLGALFQAAADSTMHRVWSLVRPIPDSGTGAAMQRMSRDDAINLDSRPKEAAYAGDLASGSLPSSFGSSSLMMLVI